MPPRPPVLPAVPVLPDTAPFTPEQRAWLNGYLAGLFSRGPLDPVARAVAPASTAGALKSLTILFGSQTGTAEGLAKKAAKEAGKRGFAATVLDMAQTDAAKLAAEKNVLLITSTFGEGEPPDNARALLAALTGEDAPSLAALRFAVCGLGDTNYTHFCQCGKDFDACLEKLGAIRVAARVDCDLDYEGPFTQWLDHALTALGSPAAEAAARHDDGTGARNKSPPAIPQVYSRKNPFAAPVLAVRCLSAAGSAKEVNHIELSLHGSGLAYEAGDALGVYPQNCPVLVADILSALGCDGEEAVVSPDGGSVSLRRALTELYDLGPPPAELLALCAVPSVFHVLDALVAAPAKPAAPALVAVLRKLQPRLYSIASSPKAHPGQVHLTVGAVRYAKDGRARKGTCSAFLAERALAAGLAGVFVHSNPSFRPPASGDVPMIMVGPGTGIAPFRAFLEERAATGARGKNWLFFGDQHAASDFLYRDELFARKSSGILTHLDLAFSRDQPEKIYVQHRMQENARELYAWLEAGAHFYVCGDASHMARDVDAALHQVIAAAGSKSPAAATAYVQALKAARRYARDVY